MTTGFQKELEQLINKHSLENGSDTPDFILAEYLMKCLEAFNAITRLRSQWYSPPPCTQVVPAWQPLTGVQPDYVHRPTVTSGGVQ